MWYNKLENEEVDLKVVLLPKITEVLQVRVQELPQVNDSNYFSTVNNNSTIKNIANIVHNNTEIKQLYEKLLASKDLVIAEKDARIKLLEHKLLYPKNNRI